MFGALKMGKSFNINDCNTHVALDVAQVFFGLLRSLLLIVAQHGTTLAKSFKINLCNIRNIARNTHVAPVSAKAESATFWGCIYINIYTQMLRPCPALFTPNAAGRG